MHVRFRETSLKDPLFMTGIGLAFLFVAISLLGPFLAPFNPWDMSFAPISPPSETHYLGVNDGGQDIFSELLYAVRNTVLFGFISAFTALAIGVILGASAGWFGGFVDMIVMRIADVLLAVPAIMILIFAAAVFRPTPWTLALILAGFIGPPSARGSGPRP
jgi:peptide/nickel transport system permease protein